MITYKNLVVLPTYHDSLDFTHELRKIFYSTLPDIIAIEFPESLQDNILLGIDRLPKISVVLYYDEFLQKQLYIPINPADSLTEAIRLAQEYGIQLEFIDLFIKNYSPELLPQPDSYVLNYMSLSKFYNIMNKELEFKKRAQISYRNNIIKEKEEINNKVQEMDELESNLSSKTTIGKDAEQWLQDSHALDDLRNSYMASRLNELMEENPTSTILVVIGMSHWERIKLLLEQKDVNPDITAFSTEVDSQVFNIRQDDLPKIVSEIPNIIFQYELFRQQQKLQWDDLEQKDLSTFQLEKYEIFEGLKDIFQRAVERYELEYDEKISIHKLKSLFQYSRNLPLIENRIKPDLFDIVLASKSILNDDFAWILWEEAKFYPLIEDPAEIPTLDFTSKGLLLDGKYFTLRRNIPLRLKKVKIPLKEHPKEKFNGEWREEWNKNRWNLVSHIPEDIFEENYFHHIRERSLAIIKDSFVKVHKFSSTLMDGIDFRETIRNWPLNQEIYVREEYFMKGSVDTVVIIFDPDKDGEDRYPYDMMWYAEHAKESDLAFYSTYPGINLIGPGISRVELGGVASFFPPRGIPNIWGKDFVEDYPFLQNKAERLLLTALLFAQKKYVTYVAQMKPRKIFFNIASRFNIKIIYLPLNRFNPVSLRSLRNLHILAGKSRRDIAHKYIHKKKS